jgi:hypothetical protein
VVDSGHLTRRHLPGEAKGDAAWPATNVQQIHARLQIWHDEGGLLFGRTGSIISVQSGRNAVGALVLVCHYNPPAYDYTTATITPAGPTHPAWLFALRMKDEL